MAKLSIAFNSVPICGHRNQNFTANINYSLWSQKVLFVSLRQGLIVLPELAWKLLCRSGWPHTHRACFHLLVLGLKACDTTTPGLMSVFYSLGADADEPLKGQKDRETKTPKRLLGGSAPRSWG